MMSDMSLEPTSVAPVSFHFGFLVGGSHRRRGSVHNRQVKTPHLLEHRSAVGATSTSL